MSTTRNVARKCKTRCAGGSPCCLDAAIYHTWHICKEPLCECHFQHRKVTARRPVKVAVRQ